MMTRSIGGINPVDVNGEVERKLPFPHEDLPTARGGAPTDLEAIGRVATRIISLGRSEGTELQLLSGKRVIGRCYWHIRRPFLLVVDEDSLPHVPER